MTRTITVTGMMALALMLATTAYGSPHDDLWKLCDDYWQGELKANPTTATSLGDKRYDDQLDDITPQGITRDKIRLDAVLARAKAIPEGPLSLEDKLTRTALITGVENSLAYNSCAFYKWTVDPLGGPQAQFMNLADYTNLETP